MFSFLSSAVLPIQNKYMADIYLETFCTKVLFRDDTLSTLLVHEKLNINVKQKIDLKTKYSVKIWSAAVPQCLQYEPPLIYDLNGVITTISFHFCFCTGCVREGLPHFRGKQGICFTSKTYNFKRN